MTASIYHLFRELLSESKYLKSKNKLEGFPFNKDVISCKNKGKFPDVALRLNRGNKLLPGGEFIEMKDSKSYNVTSFNSTIPTGTKKISDIITGDNNKIAKQMEAAGDDINALPDRDVFYLVRGRSDKTCNKTKVCLVHGDFFCTIPVERLIQESFGEALNSRLKEMDLEMSADKKLEFVSLFSQRHIFSSVRTVEKASVKLRFRVMSEARQEANILNDSKYPLILDDSANLILPLTNVKTRDHYVSIMEQVFSKEEYKQLKVTVLKHLIDGEFLLFQKQI
ncbi:MAG: hypothetical protein K0U41_09275 [Gammaproteobacteria bacterium]|nr:hypothetical protein [Gammaproteobacteria bacterium]